MRRTSLAAAVAAALVATAAPVTAATSGPSAGPGPDPARARAVGETRPAVIGHRVIGKTVAGRKIHAWRVGERDARIKAVALATMHGDEIAVRQILRSIRDGRPVKGIDLWLIPVLNRDGVARETRKNKHGVDLNRNFPVKWAELDGEIESGPRPRSEPETRALMRFLNRVDPRFLVSLHQPLHGIDVYGPKKRWFARRLARELHLPTKEFACGNACHGTMTQWFNKRHDGVAVTVEYGAHPKFRRMNRYAPRQLIRALGGSR